MCLHNYAFPVVRGVSVTSDVMKMKCAKFKNSPVSSLPLLKNIKEYNLFLVIYLICNSLRDLSVESPGSCSVFVFRMLD